MIERKIINYKFLEFKVGSYIRKKLNDVPIQKITVEKNPMGERITIYTSTPGLVIGREGSNIKELTRNLKAEFQFENPQVKIGEVDNIFLSAAIVAKRIANDLSNFGSQRFKLTAFKAVSGVMQAGALGVEIKISGKLPSARAKSWRFVKGYLKKTGYVSDFLIDKAQESVTLKTGVIGIKVAIMLPNTPLPDKITYVEAQVQPELLEKVIAEEKKVQEEKSEKNKKNKEEVMDNEEA
ncbi:30S ribosomal protein S3 [Candidatus Woesearchaeota archaeon]|nr:30S ribosomal protein S3 [Nanoarchaeota archaeon]MCB9370327.1 30S ribosomal protein S3 [Candidatus Woesearchaeota archaeon]USN44849.1 MAG: 30S ribosomal protein S3 [Candidatus Woesearchaeota archaeon]